MADFTVVPDDGAPLGSALNRGAYDCAAKAEPNEPTFTLLARHPLSGALVMLWAAAERMDPAASPEKIANAEMISGEMVTWLQANRGKDPAGTFTLARALTIMAELVGAVVRIEQAPLEPLAMGNYAHTVDVRPKRPAAA